MELKKKTLEKQKEMRFAIWYVPLEFCWNSSNFCIIFFFLVNERFWTKTGQKSWPLWNYRQSFMAFTYFFYVWNAEYSCLGNLVTKYRKVNFILFCLLFILHLKNTEVWLAASQKKVITAGFWIVGYISILPILH